MKGIVEFLTARLDEDERIAQAASARAPWSHTADDYWMITGADGGVVVYDESAPSQAEAAHIARHNPVRVLAEVAAKRVILGEHSPQHSDLFPEDKPQWCQTCSRRGSWPCDTVRTLLGPYADHPHFHPAWAR